MRIRRYWLVAAFFLLSGADCGDEAPKPELESMVRFWSFTKFVNGATGEERIGDERVQVGGKVAELLGFGGLVFSPPGYGPNAEAEVFSNETGQTYWVSAVGPNGTLATPGVSIGNSASLTQYQYFRKTDPNATLQIVVSKTFLEGIDANFGLPTALECPWHVAGTSFIDCQRIMSAWVSFDVSAFSFFDQNEFVKTGGFAEITGWRGVFDYDAYTTSGSKRHLWDRSSFDFDPDVDGSGGGHAILHLATPITIEIPLATVRTGDLFYLLVTAKADTLNHRQRESFLSAYFRDPSQAEGLSFEYVGLEPVETPTEKPAEIPAAPAAACAAPDPEAGTVQFDAATFDAPELPGDGATVFVTRTGGSRGAVSVRLATGDDTALADADYTAVDTQVLFADGEEGSRGVRIPFVTDGTAEPDKTVRLTLSEPGGCATLGAQSTATLTILDDDRPIVLPDTFTVGGTVTGLEGTGLVLSEAVTGFHVTPTGGPFTFSYQYPTGTEYDVRVASQPVNPFQVCTVTRGQGTVAGANVTDVAVDCVTVPTNGALDPGFGGGGKVTVGPTGGASAMALQADGKIVIVGGRTLARYRTDGTLDPDFGTGGQVTIQFNGGLLDAAEAVAVQTDKKIVVAGRTRSGSTDDFAVARYLEGGTPDPSFGSGGKTNVDFNGSTDQAWAVLIQIDGKIVLAGHAATPSPIGGDNDFAAARLTAGGVLDGSFGSGGKVITNIGGKTDLAHAAALQGDGKIVLAGRVADGGGDNPDVGLVRYDTAGAPDMGFGDQGIVRENLSGDWDEAVDVVVDSNGKIVVGVVALVGSTFQFEVARFDTAGDLDRGFGNQGTAATPFSTNNDFARALALQADGKIVVVGQASNLMSPDFGIARFGGDGVIDGGFGTAGKLRVDFFGASDDATCVAVQTDGKIVVGGLARNGTTNGTGLIRILP